MSKDNSVELFKELARFIGLKKFNVDMMQDHLSANHYFRLSAKIDWYNITANSNPSELVKKVFGPIIEDIQKSDCVQEEVGKLKQDLKDAQSEIARLAKFENYYNLAYNLQNGN